MIAPNVEEGADLPEAPRAKHLPLVGKMPLPDLVPARMVNEVLFCERLLYLEWAQGEWAENVFTVDGRAVHARTDEKKGDLPAPPATGAADDDAVDEPDGPPYKATSVELSSARLGVIAKIDLVEEGRRAK